MHEYDENSFHLGTQPCQRTIEMVVIEMIVDREHIDILLSFLDNKISLSSFNIFILRSTILFHDFAFSLLFFWMTDDDDIPVTTVAVNRQERVRWWIEIIGFW